MHAGINFALDNIRAGRTAGWAAGTEEDRLPRSERAAFASGVRMVEELNSHQLLAIRRLLSGSASIGDAQSVPTAVLAEIRKRESNLDHILFLVESGVAKPYLPPYGDEDA